MADINIFGRPTQTTISDTDKIAAGSGASAFFNVTWAAFKDLILTYLGTKQSSGTIGGNQYTDYDNFNGTTTRVVTGSLSSGTFNVDVGVNSSLWHSMNVLVLRSVGINQWIVPESTWSTSVTYSVFSNGVNLTFINKGTEVDTQPFKILIIY